MATEFATNAALDFLAHFGLIDRALQPDPQQQRFELLQTWVIKTPDFRFPKPLLGFETFAEGELIAIDGDEEVRLHMHYYDSRGVFRIFRASADDVALRLWNDAPGFSQRYTGTFADGGDTIEGIWQLRTDAVHWHDDLRITYRRRSRS